jgi:hypothetical protein
MSSRPYSLIRGETYRREPAPVKWYLRWPNSGLRDSGVRRRTAPSMVAVESRARLKLGVDLRNRRGFGLG